MIASGRKWLWVVASDCRWLQVVVSCCRWLQVVGSVVLCFQAVASVLQWLQMVVSCLQFVAICFKWFEVLICVGVYSYFIAILVIFHGLKWLMLLSFTPKPSLHSTVVWYGIAATRCWKFQGNGPLMCMSAKNAFILCKLVFHSCFSDTWWWEGVFVAIIWFILNL